MEDIIFTIKESLSKSSRRDVDQKIHVWCNQFRNRGISILALETLLNSYSDNQAIKIDSVYDGFCSPNTTLYDEDQTIIQLRNELERLKCDKKKLEDKLDLQKKRYLFIIVIFFIVVLLLFAVVKLYR